MVCKFSGNVDRTAGIVKEDAIVKAQKESEVVAETLILDGLLKEIVSEIEKMKKMECSKRKRNRGSS